MLDTVCFAPGTPLIFLFQLINGITMINDKQLIFGLPLQTPTSQLVHQVKKDKKNTS